MGYDSTTILNKVKDALLKVKNGEAVYERDSVIFDEIEYSWPLLAGLMWITAQNEGRLSVLDFGGSLGSTYFQNRTFFKNLKRVEWNIVEQDNFVKAGKENFQSEELKFFNSIEELMSVSRIHIALLSSVLPYIRSPYELIQKIMDLKIDFIIFDRMPMLEGDQDRITVQKVLPEIYVASYPSWFFSEPKFLEFMGREYKLIEQFKCVDKANVDSVFKGYIFKIGNEK